MNYCESFCRTIQRLCNTGAAPLLPPEYQQVEYIESSGGQYINIGAANNHQYYDIDFMQVAGVYSSLAAQYNLNGLLGINGFGNVDVKVWLSYTSPYNLTFDCNGALIGKIEISLNTRYRCYFSPVSFIVNNVDYTLATTGAVTSTNQSVLFSINNANSNWTVWSSAIRLYHCKTSSIDLYPCYRKSDNKPGLYDLVSGTFYVNQGSGEFTVGANV